jgi:hypothetical protein
MAAGSPQLVNVPATIPATPSRYPDRRSWVSMRSSRYSASSFSSMSRMPPRAGHDVPVPSDDVSSVRLPPSVTPVAVPPASRVAIG